MVSFCLVPTWNVYPESSVIRSDSNYLPKVHTKYIVKGTQVLSPVVLALGHNLLCELFLNLLPEPFLKGAARLLVSRPSSN